MIRINRVFGKNIQHAVCLFLFLTLLVSAVPYKSNAEAPEFSQVSSTAFADDAKYPQALSAYKNAVYVSDQIKGLRIVDISDISNPKDVTVDDDAYKGMMYGGGAGSCVSDGFLYACFSESSPDKTAAKGVRKYDLSDPLKPKFVCTYEIGFRAYAVAASNGYVFVADLERGLKIYKGNDTKPVRFINEGTNRNKLTSLFIRDDYLYVSYHNGIYVYNIKNPENITIYSEYTFEEYNAFSQITADENGVYCIAKGDDNCTVVLMLDLSDDKGNPAYLREAKITATSLDVNDSKATCIRCKDGYLYVAYANGIAALELSGMPEIKLAKRINCAASYFVITDEYIFGAGSNTFMAVTTGKLGTGTSIADHQTLLDGVKKKNYYRENISFSDIKEHKNRAVIEQLANTGIVSWNSEDKFRPDDNITFAEYISMLLKTIGINYVDYIDAYIGTSADDWYAGDIQAAYDIGLLEGFDVAPSECISRSDAAVIAKRAVEYVNEKKLTLKKNNRIKDAEEIDASSKDGVAFCIDSGIMSTDKNGKFKPTANISRADAAEMLSNVLKYLESKRINRETFRQAPIIIRTSDAVNVGDAFNIYGEGFAPESTRVKIKEVTSAEKTSLPPEDAIELKTVFEDENGQYISTVLPKSVKPGVYAVWVENKYGWSKPAYINKARTQWISTDQTASGCDVYVTGRNFDGAEFGAETKTKVLLKGDNGEFEVNQKTVAPYYVLFTVDESVPDGKYRVYVSNDGILYEEQSSEQILTVKRRSYDPYNLNVSWTDEFNWENVVNVKDFGAKGNGNDNDSAAINAAIESVWMQGGVVYFPEGTYISGSIKVPGHVVLAGDGMDKTKILYQPDIENKTPSELKSVMFVQTDYARCGEEGRQGLVNLTLDYCRDENGNSYHPSVLPGQFVWLGGQWNTRDVPKRTASYIFMKGVRFGSHSMDYKNVSEEHMAEYFQGQTRTYVLADKYVLCEDNVFEMDCGAFTGYYNGYIQTRNNRTNVLAGSFYNHAMYSVYDNNHLQNLEHEYGKTVRVSRQGIYYKTHSLLTNNSVRNSASWTNDGEVFATEAYQSGNNIFGEVVSAGTSSLKVEGYKNAAGYELRAGGNATGAYGTWNVKERAYGVDNVWRVVIVGGKGVGQVRAILSSDIATHTLQVDKPWTVLPDSTSKFTVYMPEDENTVYNNELYDTGWGMLSYGNTTDIVYADNTALNSTGIQFWSILVRGYNDFDDNNWNCRNWHQYFCRADRNKLLGAGWKSKLVAIELAVSASNNFEMHGYYNYGQEIKNNTIKGENLSTRDMLNHWRNLETQGAHAVGEGYYSGISIPFAPDGGGRHLPYFEEKGIQALTIQSNHLMDLDRGITLGGLGCTREEERDECTNVDQCNTHGVVIKSNTFENVNTPYCRFGDTGTVFLDDDGNVKERS